MVSNPQILIFFFLVSDGSSVKLITANKWNLSFISTIMSYYNSYDSRGGDSSSRRDYGGSAGYGGGSSYGGGSNGYSGGYGNSSYGGGSSYGNGGSSYGNGGSSYGGASSYGAGGGGYGGGGSDDFGSNLSNIDFSKTELVPFEKDFYIEHPDVSKRPMEEANAWRASKQIVIVGKDVPKPCMTFEEASMPEYILSEVLKQGFEKPTPIQSQGKFYHPSSFHLM